MSTPEHAALPRPPARKLAVLACMDARIDPNKLLGLSDGDAHVIRNAGGVVSDDALRSLALSQHLMGTEEIVLIHHTDCGLLNITDDEFAARLEAEAGETPDWPIHAFDDLEQNLRASIAKLEQSPFVPHTDKITGYEYEVETGRLRQVS
jgi:carbonic anhydrase